MFKSATTFDVPKDLYTSGSENQFYFFPKAQWDSYLPKEPCVGIFCLYHQIPLEGVNLGSNAYMTKTDFFKAWKKEKLFKLAFKKCGNNFMKVGSEI